MDLMDDNTITASRKPVKWLMLMRLSKSRRFKHMRVVLIKQESVFFSLLDVKIAK
jgi:hypothetical protein